MFLLHIFIVKKILVNALYILLYIRIFKKNKIHINHNLTWINVFYNHKFSKNQIYKSVILNFSKKN